MTSHRIAVITPSIGPQSEEAQAFRLGLRDLGYVEGENISIEWWYGSGHFDQIPEIIAQFVRRKPDVLVVESTVAASEAKRITTTIPIVMALVGDPVGSGLVTSLGRPGGNVTGVANMTADLATKRLQLLKEAIPTLKRVAVLWNPNTAWHGRNVVQLKAAQAGLGLKLTFIPISNAERIAPALSGLNRSKVDAVLALDDAFMTSHGETVLQMMFKARLPVAYGWKSLAEKGVLITYAPEGADLFRLAAGYVDKILRGASPANLPVEEPTKFKLILNLKTAKALHITIPESILLRADEVIQ